MSKHEVQFGKLDEMFIVGLNVLGDDSEDCAAIDIFSVDGEDYIALVELESGSLYILKVLQDDKEDMKFKLIEDEELEDEIYHLFEHQFSDDDIDLILDEYYEKLYGDEEEMLEEDEDE